MLCTHRQCELNVTGIILTCPCHGAEFSSRGKLLQGPAETDLQSLKLSLSDSTIIIIIILSNRLIIFYSDSYIKCF